MRLGGVSEVAAALAVTRQRVLQLRDRADFPDPVAELAIGPVWDLDAMGLWLGSGSRRGPGRPPSGAGRRVVGDRFELEEPPINSGGFGEVYRAVDRKNATVVAVKLLKNVRNIDDEAVKRFRRELRIMHDTLDHPHVMPVLAHGDCDDLESIWCAMPLARGSLVDEIASFTGDHAAVVDLARQICYGLGYAHAAHVLHRDLKPGNILRTADGLWAISDFGLAREAERLTEGLTSTLAQGMGTYFYASPEQWARPKTAEVRDDVFSVGKILQHALTGEIPMMSAEHIAQSPLRPVIQRATGARANRYASAAALLEAIEQAVSLYDPTWEPPQVRMQRLSARVVGPTEPIALDELLNWLQNSDRMDSAEELDAACQLLVACSASSIEYLWQTNPDGLRVAFRSFGVWAHTERFDFGYCDTVATFATAAVRTTGDNEILRTVVNALVHLGARHNRWHVRDEVTGLLQRIREHEQALVALEALQAAPSFEVRWAMSDFAVRSLQPALRDGIRVILHPDQAAS